MTTFHRTTVLALAATVSFVSLASTSAVAAPPQALLVAPGEPYGLPKFGFSSFNLHGVGERVTFVRWGGLASRLGLEPGDVILTMNGYPLSYNGSWNDALGRAMSKGGLVKLRIRDVRTGAIARRQIFVGYGNGPITPKYYTNNYNGPAKQHGHYGPHPNQTAHTIKEIVELFDND